MTAACPSCGLALVAGYVKCPRCGATVGAARRASPAGGTAVASGFPRFVIAVPVVMAIVIVLIVALRGGDADEGEPADEPAAQDAPAATPVAPVTRPSAPPESAPGATVAPRPEAPDHRPAVAQLERALRSQRLWSTITADPPYVDIRSAACREPAMARTLAMAEGSLRAVGLTRLRCLAQSGAVVIQRDL
jgi:hypothetical protein